MRVQGPETPMTCSQIWRAGCVLLVACASSLRAETRLTRFEFSQVHMGTEFRIVLYAPDAATSCRASQAAFDRIADLDNTMSDYRPSSELMQLCRHAGGPAIKVSEDLFRVLAKAEEVARKSDGAFDITVGPVVRLWRRARRQHELPDPESLAQALRLVGYENLRLDSNARAAQLLRAGMLLDLGGIAKGDAADQALQALSSFGIASALVAAGGDIAVSNPPPGNRGWLIGIAPLDSPARAKDGSSLQNPKSQMQDGLRYVSLRNAAISTSGEEEQHAVIAGRRYSHIVDPKTGLALTGRSSVTVIAPNGITSDSLATAVSVLGPKRGLELADSTPGTAVLFVLETTQGIRSLESRFPPE